MVMIICKYIAKLKKIDNNNCLASFVEERRDGSSTYMYKMTSVKVVKYRGSTLRGTFEGHKGSDYGKIEMWQRVFFL